MTECGKIICGATFVLQNSGKSIVQNTTQSEHELYQHKTFKIQESSAMVVMGKT
jgi:hypothetical protein